MTIQMSGTISKHDIYGSHFKTAYNNTGNDIELSLEDFEAVENKMRGSSLFVDQASSLIIMRLKPSLIQLEGGAFINCNRLKPLHL
jgi:hypothetical protein